MNLDDLRDQLRDQLRQLGAQVADSPAYQSLKEKYDSLEPRQQKTAIISVVCLTLAILIWIPLSIYLSSREQMTYFEESRDLTRELLRTERQASQIGTAGPGLPPGTLQQRVHSVISAVNLIDEQRGSVQDFQAGGPTAKGLIPTGVNQEGAEVQLKNLNLRQVVDIGQRLESIHPTVKLWGMDIRASAEDGNYFDVTYQLLSFAIPQEEPEAATPPGRPGRPRIPPPRPPGRGRGGSQ